MTGMSRRAFLVLGGGAALGALVVSAGVILARDDTDVVRDRLSAFLSDHDGARALGLRYLRQAPQSDDELAAAIAPASVDPRMWFETVNDDEFARHVRGSVRDDFARADVVSVDGWQLAASEARVCGIWARVS